MSELSIGEHAYQVGRLTPRQQLHLARRLLPLFTDLPAGMDPEHFDAKALGPFAKALAALTDAEADALVDPCLGVVARKVGETWSPLMPHPGMLMFQDIGVDEIVQLVWAVIQENLGNFFLDTTGTRPA